MGSNGRDAEAEADEMPQHTVTVDAFWIDETEVSNAMYAACVQSGVCDPLVSTGEEAATNPHHPAQGVTWTNARRYCEWVGRRLPTEAEWEKAARGTDGRLYPWGNTLRADTQVNIDFRREDVTAVGQNADDVSPYGVRDMGGNVREWVTDWYGEDAYATAAAVNPTGPPRGLVRVLRGGSWNAAPRAARAANRFWAFPDRNDFDGFRCALTAGDA